MGECDVRGSVFNLMEHFHVLGPALVSQPSVSCPHPVLTEGQSVKLTCDGGSFVWTNDGRAVVSGDRLSFHDSNRVLSISPLDLGTVRLPPQPRFKLRVSQKPPPRLSLAPRLPPHSGGGRDGPDTPTVLQLPAKAEFEEQVRLICSAASLP